MRSFVLRSLVLHSLAAVLAILTAASSPAPAQTAANTAAQPRITAAIDELSLVALAGNTHPLAQAKFDRGPAPANMPANRLLLVLSRSTQQEADLRTWLESLQDAHSPNYRKFINPDEFGKRFGVSEGDLETIRTWLTGRGFTVSKVTGSRMAIEFSGTVGQIEIAFHTSIHTYEIAGEQHWANASDPQIPAALAPVVAGLASLSNFRPKAQVIRGPSGTYDAKTHTISPAYTNGNASQGYYIYLGPADAATIYDTPTTLNPALSGTAYTGSGVTIGIAGDSNIDIAQNANYRSTFGLPASATKVAVDGDDPGENGDAIEAYLDTEVAGGLAPGANVILYTAANTDYEPGLFLAISRALDDNQADILNVSFGGCEAAQGASGNQYILDLWEQAAAQGIAVTVSSGDSGSAGCDNDDIEAIAGDGLAVNGLGSTPYNVSVGGTDYDVLASNFPTSFTDYVDITNSLPNHRSALSYIPEEPWNNSTYPNTSVSANEPISVLSGNAASDNIEAGGGGISGVYAVPTWQSTFASGTGRNLPDVSLLAANGFYGALWGICTDLESGADCAAGATGNNFNLTGVGGTSASAPAFAGMLALVEQKAGSRLGQADYAIYNLAKSSYSTIFHDIDTGDNSVNCTANTSGCASNSAGYDFMTGYNAVTGYDRASGLGSVNAAKLTSSWANAGLVASTSSLKLNGGTGALSITHGASVAVDATVSGSGGTPAGAVALVDSLSPANAPNNEGIAAFTLAAGTAAGTTDSLPGGTYQVSAHYGGSSTYSQSDSNAISVTVAPENSTTKILSVTAYDPTTGKPASANYYGELYVIDAQPYGTSSSLSNPDGAATGTISFNSGSTNVGSAALGSNGIAALQTTTLPGGSDSLTAVYPGDASFKGSTSAAYAVTIIPAVTTLNTTYYTGSATNTISMVVDLTTSSVGTAPTGMLTIENGTQTIGTTTLDGLAGTGTASASASASFTSSVLAPGTYSLTAVYAGDGNYAGSTSSAVSVTLSRDTPTLTVTPSATTILANQPLTVIVTPSPVAGAPLPTGSVTLNYNGYPGVTTSPVNLVNGTATLIIPGNSLNLGNQGIAANYSGDTVYTAATASIDVTVNSAGTFKPTITVTGPSTPVRTYPFSVTVTLTGPGGDPVPTGSISISTANYQNTGALSKGSVTFAIQGGQNPGPNTFSAVYLGDSNYLGGTGTGVVSVAALPYISFSPYEPTIIVNEALPLTISIVPPANVPEATGTVTLSSSAYTSSAAKLNAGSATITIPANTLKVGSNTVYANYSGDQNYLPGNNGEVVYVNPAPAPGLSITGTAVSVTAGATTGNTSTLTLTPSNGFTGPVSLSCAITPVAATNPATCSIPASVTIAGIAAQTSSLTIDSSTTTTPGTYTATVTGTSGTIKASASVTVTIIAPPVPGLAISGTAVSVAPGATTGNTSTITLTPSNGFTGAVNLTCSISPAAASDPATCSIPASVTITGTAAQTTTLTVNTTAATTTSLNKAKKSIWPSAGGAALALILLFGIPSKRRRWQSLAGALLLILSFSAGLSACGGGGNSGGGGGNPGTTPGAYTVTVTGTSGSITQTAAISLTVQ